VSDELIPQGQLLIYNDSGLHLQVRLDGQTVWLTQAQMAELYQTTPQNITLHIQGIYDDGELPEDATCKEYLQVRQEGARQVQRSLKHYSLDMILAVGYRVRSPRGTLFRQWATTRLRELLIKGFTLDDERIKAGRTIGADYFDELLARIRDIYPSSPRRCLRSSMLLGILDRVGRASLAVLVGDALADVETLHVVRGFAAVESVPSG
jgi:hypothetical protein